MDFRTKSKEELIQELLRQKQELDSLKVLFDHEVNHRNRVESILNASPDTIFISDLEGRVLFTSPMAMKMFGYEEAEFPLNSPLFNFIDPTDHDKAKDAIRLMFEGTFIGATEYVCIKADGSKIDVEVNGEFLRDAEGKPTSMVFVVRDVSDRKLAEEKVKDAEQRFRLIFENVFDGICIVEEDADPKKRKLVECNEQYAALAGRSRQELLELAYIYDSLTKHQEEFADEERLKGISEQTAYHGTFSWMRPDGKDNTIEYIARPITWRGKSYSIGIDRDITDSKQIEDQLRKLSQAVEQSPVSIVITNLDGNIEYANPKASQTTGYTLEELKGKNPRVLKSGETPMDEYQYLWDSISQGNVWKGIFHNKRKNGELYWGSSQITPIIDENGQITSYLALKEDITERKQIQEELVKSEERFRQIAEQSQTVIWEVDPLGLYTYVNQLAETVWGYTPEELIGKKYFYDLHPAENREAFKIAALDSIHRKEPFLNLHNQIVTADNRIIWVSTNGVPVLNNQNSLIGYRGADNDITDRIKAEDALRINEEALNKAQEIAQMCSWELDLINEKLTWSKNYYHLMGIQDGTEMKTGFFLDRVHPDDLHLVNEKVEEMKKHRHPVIYDIRLQMPNNEYRWIQNNIVPEFDGDTMVRFKGVNIDVTEKKQAEESIKQQNERLSAIINAIPDLIFVSDREGTYLEYYNASAQELLYSEDTLIGSTVWDVFDEETANLHIRKINECLQNNNLVTFEYATTKTGTNQYFEARLAPLGKDKVLRFVRDFTQEKQKDAELKKLYLSIAQSPVITVITDLHANIEYVNPAFNAITGYSNEEVLGQNVRILQSGKTDQAIYMQLWETIHAGKEWHGEWINKKKNGELYWEDVRITPVRDDSGKVTSYLAVKQDISQRKRAEQEIKDLNANLELRIEERTSQLANIIKGTNVGTWEWNVQSGETVFNERWAEFVGYTLDELSPVSIQTWLALSHPDDLKKSGELLEKHFKGESEYYSFESRMKHKSGDWVWVLDRGQVHRWDQDGKPLIMSGTHQDITERKLAENFENELLQLSPTLTGLSLDKINDAINMALSRIGQFLLADRAYVFEFAASNATMSNTHEWCNSGINPEIENLQGLPCEVFPHWMEALHRQENVVIASVENLPESWQDLREMLEPQGIQSLIAMPLITDGVLIGFVGLDSVVRQKEYTHSEINILKVWSSMLASLINNQRSGVLLEQTRQNYETFFNTIDDFLWVLDEQGNIIHTNNTVNNRLEYTSDELLNQSVLMVHPAERREEAGRIVGEMLLGTADFCPVPIVTKSGAQIPVQTRVKSGNWNGMPVIFGVSKDISQLQLSEQKFSSAFHSSSSIMTITRFTDDQFVDVNNAFVSTLGYSREEMVGQTLISLGIVRDVPEYGTIQELIDKGVQLKELEVNVFSKSNELLILLMSIEDIYIGTERCILSVGVNITERKSMENELRKAREEADLANLAKSEFLSRMSHELRTPMNSILGFAQLLEMSELNARQSKGVTHILKSGKHLLDLINEVLDISSIEAGNLSLSLEPVQLNGVISEMMDLVKIQANESQIRLELTDSSSNQLFVKADRQRLKQIVLNLLNNAIKYNRDNGLVTIQTELRPTNSFGLRLVRISITDTGFGISEADLPKLFKPFERIGAEKTGTEGSGLGLSVVKKLVEAMKGNLGVESTLDVGSTFWFEFPYSESQLENAMKSGGLESIEQTKVNKTGTIVYIEDNISNIELVEQILSHHRPDLRLITNMNGKQAVKLACDYRPDLVLLDLDLPDIHGSEVLKRLQADEKTREIPVIIISADVMPNQIEKLLNAGARNYLTKPLDVVEFLKAIDAFLDLKD